jgi:hypothetical protein
MELNLAASNCTEIRITTKCEIDQNLLKKIKECSALSEEIIKEEAIAFRNNYLIDGKKHCEVGYVLEIEKQKIFFIAIHYHLGVLPKRKIKFKPVSQLLECLKELNNDKITFDCNVKFEYVPSKHNSVVPLPLRLPSSLFDEVRGFRFIKMKNKELNFDVIIERPFNKKIYHSINYEYEGKFSQELPRVIFDLAINISKNFIKEK